MNRVSAYGWLAIVWFLAGCSALTVAPAAENPGLPTPTHSSFFNNTVLPTATSDQARPAGGTPTVALFFDQPPTATPTLPVTAVTAIPTAAVLAATATPSDRVITATVYAGQLNPNWILVAAPGMQLDPANASHLHGGSVSLAMTPQIDFSKLSLLVSHSTTVAYPRRQVLAISFWLNSGSDTLSLSNLAVTILGSNAYPYWAADDASVQMDAKHFFSETRLYDLGLHGAIPPQTWVQVNVQLDKLIFDPDYKYVTGFYIKNDAGFLRTVYIDDVNLLMINPAGQVGPNVLPTGTVTYMPTMVTEPTLFATPTAPEQTPTATQILRPSATSTLSR